MVSVYVFFVFVFFLFLFLAACLQELKMSPYLCLDSTYIVALLMEGFGFTEDRKLTVSSNFCCCFFVVFSLVVFVAVFFVVCLFFFFVFFVVVFIVVIGFTVVPLCVEGMVIKFKICFKQLSE